MGTNNLSSIGASIVRAVGNQLDQYFTALTGVIVPRKLDGTPETGTQDLGSTTYKFRNGYLDQINVDNIKIDGNTISSTDTDGNILVTPNGTGEFNVTTTDADVNLDTGTGRTKITRLIGATGAEQSKLVTRSTEGTTTDGTTVQATTDILVVGYGAWSISEADSIAQAYIKITSDNATPPTTVIQYIGAITSPNFPQSLKNHAFSFAVKKGDYYRIECFVRRHIHGTSVANAYWREIEIGA